MRSHVGPYMYVLSFMIYWFCA